MNKKTLGFLGPRGTFSHQAALKFVGSLYEYELREYNTIIDVLIAVSKDEIDEALVPIENSIEGAVNATLDMLSSDPELMINAEVVEGIVQNLLVKSGTDRGSISAVISHPQAIGQCRKYLSRNFPDAEMRYVYSTAQGAKDVLADISSCSATVGSERLSIEYGLEIIDECIQDQSVNHTRFVVVAKKDAHRSGADKTSIVFSTDDRPGSLYRILDIFNLWDINLKRIESRPAKDELGKYIFFVDINGHRSDEDVSDAITMVRRKCSFFKFLGSYPEYFSQNE